MKPTMDAIQAAVKQDLQVDIGAGDITADLIAPEKLASATVITREAMVLCGQAWFDAAFHLLDDGIKINWLVEEGEQVAANTALVTLSGSARALLSAERTALNWLQSLSGVATTTARYVDKLQGTHTKLLDTRKTIPGLRAALKYAVKTGGANNHRFGLFDAFLIKENHIMSVGSITKAIHAAKAMHLDKLLEIEVENLSELQEAVAAGADRVMLDNFSLADIAKAVALAKGKVQLEISGNVTLDNLSAYANAGVDFISTGAITKNLQAIDLSMRIDLL